MTNLIETFKTLASNAKNINLEFDAINQEKKSTTDAMQWAAFFITMQGNAQDKEALKNLVAKDAPLEKQKGSVSRAKKVASFLIEHEAIILEDDSLTLEYVSLFNPLNDNQFSFPDIAFNALHNAVNKALKEQEASKQSQNESKALHIEALKLGAASLGLAPQEALHIKDEVIEHGLAIIAQRKEANKLQEIIASLTAQEKLDLLAMLQGSNSATAIAA